MEFKHFGCHVQQLSQLFRARRILDLSIYGIFEGYFYKFLSLDILNF